MVAGAKARQRVGKAADGYGVSIWADDTVLELFLELFQPWGRL